jgi:hypothetical protein
MPKPSKSKRPRGRPKITQKPCVNPEFNDGNDQPKENFSDTQWNRGGQNGSKCKVCVENNLGPPSGKAKKRKAERNASNELARTELQKAKKVKEQLAEAEKTGDEATILALEEEVELANASAEVARQNSYNGKQNDRNRKSNELARTELQKAEEAKDRLGKAEKTGDEALISALEKELELANASAEELRQNSFNGKRNDRRNKRQFPSGFVLDTRTLFVGLDTLRPNRKPSPRRDVSEIGQIISNGFKNDHSVKEVVAALHELKTK